MRQTIALAAAAALALGAPGFARAQEKPAAAQATQSTADEVLRKGFAYLLGEQHENGSFGSIPGMDPKAGEAGMSALALRAMAKAPPSIRKDLEPAIEKAALYLVSLQQPDGSISNPGAGLTTYRTSIAIMAFKACDPAKYAEAIARAAALVENSQWSEAHGLASDAMTARKSPYYGGFGYDQTGTKPDADMSNTQFALEALKTAGVPPDSPVWHRAVVFLQRCQNRSESNDLVPAGVKIGDDGGFMYDPALDVSKSEPRKLPDGTAEIPSYASMTYAGLMGLLYANVAKDDPRVRAAFGWIQRNYTLEENRGLGGRSNPQGSKQGLYYYYQTFGKALDAWGEREITTADGKKHRWAEELVAKLAEIQKPDGSWVNDVKRWWENDPVLCACYSLLAIEYAYPYLEGAAGKPAAEGSPEKATEGSPDKPAEGGGGK